MAIDFGAAGDLVRIQWLAADQQSALVELKNGQVASMIGNIPDDWPAGTVILVAKTEDGPTYEVVSPDAWQSERWVGIVKLVLSDVTVVDTGGHFRRINNGSIACQVGNTVEGSDNGGVVRILSEGPLRFLDSQDFDDQIADRFLFNGDKVTFDDFGGLENVKSRARELIETSLLQLDQWKKIGTRPIKGVLFTGPPGTGKTMLARIIASQTGVKFYEVSGPEILSKWYGESEKVLRAIFEQADNEPGGAIIFFDEIDSIAGRRSNDAHEASKRIVAEFLTRMDGFEASGNTLVIAATNRPQDIDIALLRPGRFDAEIEFPLPDQSDREAILRTGAKHIATAGDLPHAEIAAATTSWSAADLSAIWREATLLAIADEREEIMADDYVNGFDRIRLRREAAMSKREDTA